MTELSGHDRTFADLYRGDDVIRRNAKQCYQRLHRRAKERTCEVEGARLLRKPEIAAYLAECADEASEQADVTQERVLRELAALGMYDIGEIAAANLQGPEGIARLPASVRPAVIGWSWDRNGNFIPKLSDKKGAIEALAKHLGLQRERMDVCHSGSIDGVLASLAEAPATPQGRIKARMEGDDAGE